MNQIGKSSSFFTRFAKVAARTMGHPAAFITAAGIIVVWAITGFLLGFSDTWQLVINTGTTIVTFLMVFLIQNTQNRDTAAIHVKLDELIRVMEKADNALLDIEELEEKALERKRSHYERLAEIAKNGAGEGPEALEETPADSVRDKD